MTDSLDLNLLPLARDAGKDLPELAGLLIAQPPRRQARGRSGDRLVLYLSLAGNAPMPPVKLQSVLDNLAQAFYKTPGSVTAALRAVSEMLNSFLLARNQRSTPSGKQAIGLLTQVAVHGEKLYLAQSGPVHAYLLQAQGAEHLYEPLLSGNGLGMGKYAQTRFFQANLGTSDTLLLASLPDPAWDVATLSALHGQGPESLRRRLVNPGTLNLSALVLQARPGKGQITLLHSSGVAEPAAPALAVSDLPQPASTGPATPAEGVFASTTIASPTPSSPPPQVETPEEAIDLAQDTPDEPVAPEPPPWDEQPEADEPVVPQQPEPPAAAPWAARPAAPPSPTPSQKPRFAPDFGYLWRLLVAIGTPFARFGQSLAGGTRTLLLRMLPSDPLPSLPPATMAFIAIAIPVVVVAIGSSVYLQLGRNAQFGDYFAQAQDLALQADAQVDPAVKRADWETALTLLDRAELYQVSAESTALRQRGRTALDQLDLVRRLDYRQAVFGGLDETRLITRMALINSDLYLLDANSGQILRAIATNRGYEVDSQFICGPLEDQVGVLVDFVRWPTSYQPRAVLLGMDATGGLVFCRVGEAPEAGRLAAPPTTSFSGLQTLVLDQGFLHIADPKTPGVWVYWNDELDQTPRFYFGDEVPPLTDVVDIVVNSNELYLLHASSGITLCSGSGLDVAPLRCAETPFIDFRPGRENTELELVYPFSQVMFNPPPDPSLLFLQPQSQGIYHFSLRNLGFLRQYLPTNPLPGGPATAFTMDPVDRTLFIAAGNEVFYASQP